VVAPDVRELKVKIESLREQVASVDKHLSEQVSALERHISDKFEASHARTDAQFHALLAAINQSKAENEVVVYKQVSALAERVTAIEARLQQQSEARAA
jgi:uncharacterized protein YicC (UPF0701 family)